MTEISEYAKTYVMQKKHKQVKITDLRSLFIFVLSIPYPAVQSQYIASRVILHI